MKKGLIILFCLVAVFGLTVAVSNGSYAEQAELCFSDDALSRLRSIEKGPVYLPFDDFSGTTWVYDITVNDYKNPETLSVEWVSGDNPLKNLYFTEQRSNGGWMLKYKEYGGTGTATFRLTAALDGKTVKKDFSVTVTEAPVQSRPVQRKDSVDVTVGDSVTLSDLGIIDNTDNCEVIFMGERSSGGTVNPHDPEDADGFRYSLTKDSGFIAKEAGEYTIHIMVKPCYNLSKTFLVTVVATGELPDNPKPKKISLEEGKKLTLNAGEKLTLTPVLSPSSATAKLTWTTSDEEVVKVSRKGVIKALKKGKATVTVTTDNGKTAKISITVKAKPVSPKKIALEEGKKLKMKIGDKLTLTPKLTPSSATTKLTWSTSDEKVVRVSPKGVIKALKKGKATITVTTENGKTAEIKITVKAK